MSVKKKVSAKKTKFTESELVESPVKKVVKRVAKKAVEVDHGLGRTVIYPKRGFTDYSLDTEDGPMTAAKMKLLLGWVEVPEGDPNSEDYDVLDNNRAKVRLNNNLSNRPFRTSLGRTWESEVLNDRWNGGQLEEPDGPNGETFIIGRTGIVLDGQHRGVGLILAVQEWEADQARDPGDRVWTNWETEPTIECLVVYGISEKSKVVDTINTGEPRTLADVIFRDTQYFDGVSSGERVRIAKVAEFAIRTLAYRTAAFADAFAPNRTHSEMIEFLHRHSRLLGCVKLICEHEVEKSISSIIPLGAAAAFLFLMGCSGDTGEKYEAAEKPNDAMLKWAHWDIAVKFWKAIGDSDERVFPIKAALSAVAIDRESVSKPEKFAIVIKAWGVYCNNSAKAEPFSADQLTLEYTEDGFGNKTLAEHPLICQIDKGSPKAALEEDLVDPSEYEPEVPTEEQKELRKKTRGKLTKALEVGMTVWVVGDPVETSWSGELVELAGKNARVKVGKKFAGAGRTQAVRVVDLLDRQP